MRTLFICSLSLSLTACLEIDVKQTTPQTTSPSTTQPTTNTHPTTNPTTTPSADADGDGLTDTMEAQLGTAPNNPATDGGGEDDGTEVINGTDPLDPFDDVPGMTTSPPTFPVVAPAAGYTEHFILFEADTTSPAYVDSLLALTPYYGARVQVQWTNANEATLGVAIGRSGYDWNHDANDGFNNWSVEEYTCNDDQILCRSEIELQGTFNNPFVSFGPQTITQGGYTAYNVTFSAQIDGPGENLQNLHVTALLPTIDYIGETCEDSLLISGVGGVCVPCPGSATDDCLMVEADVADPYLTNNPGCLTPSSTYSNGPNEPRPVCPN